MFSFTGLRVLIIWVRSFHPHPLIQVLLSWSYDPGFCVLVHWSMSSCPGSRDAILWSQLTCLVSLLVLWFSCHGPLVRFVVSWSTDPDLLVHSFVSWFSSLYPSIWSLVSCSCPWPRFLVFASWSFGNGTFIFILWSRFSCLGPCVLVHCSMSSCPGSRAAIV